MNWLRPEVVVWDAVSSKLIGDELSNASNILEVGIGNGYFTFMTLGGKFSKEYDWYYNVNTEGFWSNKDIYDHVDINDIGGYVIERPDVRLKYGIDHKQNLLDQTKQLDFVETLLLQDANEYISANDVSTIYSNTIYWLRDPISAIQNYEAILNKNGIIVLVFPNSDFFKNCPSYTRENKLLTLLNRGRADSLLWFMDLKEFEKIIKTKTKLYIETYQRYIAEITLKIWDIGLRPISPHLIKMANKLDRATRMEIKEEWCETVMQFAEQLLGLELERSIKEGGFNFVVLKK